MIPGGGGCQESAGFLFAHACDRPVAWSCGSCGKAICAEHTRMTEQGYTCIACMRTLQQQQEQEKEQQEQEQENKEAAATDEDDPYFYGGDDYDSSWSVRDRSAFRSSSTSDSDDAPEADFGAS